MCCRLTVVQYQALGAVTLTAADTVTLADTGANIAALSAAQISAFAGLNIDTIDSTTNALSLTVAQYQALGGVTLTAADVVTLTDTAANIQGLSAAQIGALAGLRHRHDRCHRHCPVADGCAVSGARRGDADGGGSVTLADTGANVAALSAGAIGDLAADFRRQDRCQSTMR